MSAHHIMGAQFEQAVRGRAAVRLAMVTALRILNAGLFILCFVLVAVFLFITSAEDYLRSWIDLTAVVLGAIGTGLGIVFSIAAGKETKVTEKLWPWLQRMSRRRAVQVALTCLGLIVAVFFAHQHLFFRHVEFISDTGLRLSLVDQPGDIRDLGLLEPNEPRDLRLHVGIRRIVGQDPISSETLVSDRIDVMPLWQSSGKIRIQLKAGRGFEPVHLQSRGSN